MKNINLSVDDETYRLAEVQASSRGMSVSDLTRDLLVSHVQRKRAGGDFDASLEKFDVERRRKLLNEMFADFDERGVGLNTADILTRDALYRHNASG